MSFLLSHHELERRLLRWTGSSLVPRYPFFEGPLNAIYGPASLTGVTNRTATSNIPKSLSLSWGSADQDLHRWYNDIELAAQDCDISYEQYPDVAVYFLKGDLKEVMLDRRQVYMKQTRKAFWDWKDFKEDLRRIVDEASKIILFPHVSSLASDAIEQLRQAHPYIASSVKLGLIIGGTAVLLPALGLAAWNRLRGK